MTLISSESKYFWTFDISRGVSQGGGAKLFLSKFYLDFRISSRFQDKKFTAIEIETF